MKFGTSGLRGLVSDMTDDICAGYMRAFLAHLRASGLPPEVVLIGRDLRPSSPRIAAACAAAAVAAGVRAVDCGVLPTPALALDAAARGAPAVMVTGSHIPFDRNGLKFYRAEGEITKADEAGIVAALAKPAEPQTPLPETAAPGAVASDPEVCARYLARARRFPPAALAGLRIGVYQHSAAGRDLLVDALVALGAQVEPLGRSDRFVPIDTEAVRPEDRARAEEWTAAHRLDALVSTDGDGDRPLIADERGRFLRGDMLGVLAARHLGADAVATPVSSNTALERSGWFGRVARTRIGSPYVIEGMAALRAEGAKLPVGYEANGGFILGAAATPPGGETLDALPTRDAMLPMLAALCFAARLGAPLSALSAQLPARATASDRLEATPSEDSAALLATLEGDAAARAALLEAAGLGQIVSIDTTDGLRMTVAGEEIVHLRPSGNAPELRCYAEAADAARAEDIVARMLAATAHALESG